MPARYIGYTGGSIEVLEHFTFDGRTREFNVRLRWGTWPEVGVLVRTVAEEYKLLDAEGLPPDAQVSPMAGDKTIFFSLPDGSSPQGKPSDKQGITPRDPELPPPGKAPRNWDHERQQPIITPRKK